MVTLLLLASEVWASTAQDRMVTKEVCRDVHRRSWHRIKCQYSTLTEHWTLKFKRGAYKITVASGQHPALIAHLCSVAGTHVREMSGDHEMLIACEESRQ